MLPHFQKTSAFHRLSDNVPEEVKHRRHLELVAAFREEAEKLNQAQIGQLQLVLVEGVRVDRSTTPSTGGRGESR